MDKKERKNKPHTGFQQKKCSLSNVYLKKQPHGNLRVLYPTPNPPPNPGAQVIPGIWGGPC